MNKEQGNSAECVKNVARQNRDFFMVEGPDGTPKISSLSKAFSSAPTPEQMEEMRKGGIAVDYAIMKKMNMLAIGGKSIDDFDANNQLPMVSLHEDMLIATGSSSKVNDLEKATEIVKSAESQYLMGQATRQQGYNR